jgi:hypothetical protein
VWAVGGSGGLKRAGFGGVGFGVGGVVGVGAGGAALAAGMSAGREEREKGR